MNSTDLALETFRKKCDRVIALQVGTLTAEDRVVLRDRIRRIRACTYSPGHEPLDYAAESLMLLEDFSGKTVANDYPSLLS